VRVTAIVAGMLTSVAFVALPVVAQDLPAMTPAELAAACAPTSASTSAAHALRVLGGQDTVPRTIFGQYDLLVIKGGSDAGVQVGAQFFLRRASNAGAAYGLSSHDDILTDGWIRIVAVNDSTSIARVERVCNAIYADDYLEPYSPPQPTQAADGPIEPDFGAMARVLGAPDAHRLAGTNEYTMIDKGSEDGVQTGARFAFFRDLTAMDPLLAAPSGTPLTPVGEGVVISATGNRAMVRIVKARDAVQDGDYAAPAKQ